MKTISLKKAFVQAEELPGGAVDVSVCQHMYRNFQEAINLIEESFKNDSHGLHVRMEKFLKKVNKVPIIGN